jgi:hypothetical protein
MRLMAMSISYPSCYEVKFRLTICAACTLKQQTFIPLRLVQFKYHFHNEILSRHVVTVNCTFTPTSLSGIHCGSQRKNGLLYLSFVTTILSPDFDFINFLEQPPSIFKLLVNSNDCIEWATQSWVIRDTNVHTQLLSLPLMKFIYKTCKHSCNNTSVIFPSY